MAIKKSAKKTGAQKTALVRKKPLHDSGLRPWTLREFAWKFPVGVAVVAAAAVGLSRLPAVQPAKPLPQPRTVITRSLSPKPGSLDFRIAGKPSLSPKTMQKIIPARSPLRGKEAFVLDCALRYNVDPAVALAQFKIESDFGLQGAAVENKNPGNIRGKPVFKKKNGEMVRVDTFRKFDSWEEGIEAYFALIANGSYYYRANRFDAESIVPTYAPAADNNKPLEYIREMRRLVRQFRNLE